MNTRRGITRVDAIVVQVIVVLLVGIQTTAVQKVRDAANRSKSTNNLKQIALAVHNHNDALGKLPFLIDVGDVGSSGTGRCSVFFQLLPYLEKEITFRGFDPRVPTSYEQPTPAVNQNKPPARQIMTVYISPADESAPNGTTTKVSVTFDDVKSPIKLTPIKDGEYATTSYAANGLVFAAAGAAIPRTFQDGMSNTIMFAERYQVCSDGKNKTHNLWAFAWYSPSIPSIAFRPEEQGRETGQFTPNQPVPGNGFVLGETKAGKDKGKVTFLALNVSAGMAGFQVAPNREKQCDARVAQTPHAGGMLAALGDGSVRSLSGQMMPNTYFAALTPAGNETLGSDW